MSDRSGRDAGVCGASAAQGDIGLSSVGSAQYGDVTTADATALLTSPLALDPNSRLSQTAWEPGVAQLIIQVQLPTLS